MEDKELRKLNRKELLEILVEQSREIDSLRAQLEQMRQQLSERRFMLNEAGSIAEASLRIHQVFEAAQEAAQAYLENIQDLSGRQKAICAQMEKESREKAERMIARAEKKCAEMEKEAERRCGEISAQADAAAQAYWEELFSKTVSSEEAYAGMETLLGELGEKDV